MDSKSKSQGVNPAYTIVDNLALRFIPKPAGRRRWRPSVEQDERDPLFLPQATEEFGIDCEVTGDRLGHDHRTLPGVHEARPESVGDRIGLVTQTLAERARERPPRQQAAGDQLLELGGVLALEKKIGARRPVDQQRLGDADLTLEGDAFAAQPREGEEEVGRVAGRHDEEPRQGGGARDSQETPDACAAGRGGRFDRELDLFDLRGSPQRRFRSRRRRPLRSLRLDPGPAPRRLGRAWPDQPRLEQPEEAIERLVFAQATGLRDLRGRGPSVEQAENALVVGTDPDFIRGIPGRSPSRPRRRSARFDGRRS